MWKDAKAKLNVEIDILDIVKRLRVHQFASEVILKPRQRELVNFFDDYKLKGDDPNDTVDHRSESIDRVSQDRQGVRQDEIENLDDVLVESIEGKVRKVVRAVKNIDVVDPID